jgi:hypothetical protein
VKIAAVSRLPTPPRLIPSWRKSMDNMLLIIIVLLLLFGGGGYWVRGRYW